MKKVILAIFSLLTISFASNAQTIAPAKKEAKEKMASPTDDRMKAVPADRKTLAKVKAAPITAPAKTVAPVTAASPVTQLKKDGTPDRRYKTKKVVLVKKDGTPDMRYKENKDPKKKS
ncbi:MAG: hypothetical protein ABIT58_06400 [Ferruginibacter sp.]